MATRSTASEYQPAPPINRLRTSRAGTVTARGGYKDSSSNPGIKPNMCCAPATNGDRAAGLAPSQSASTKKMMLVRNGVG